MGGANREINMTFSRTLATPIGAFAAALLVLSSWDVQPALGAPIQLVAGSVNMFRDIRGANDVGVAQGDRFQCFHKTSVTYYLPRRGLVDCP